MKRLSEIGLKSPRPDHFQTLTVRSEQEDEEAILRVLSVIRYNDLLNDLVLLNYYKEMPISFGATVEQIESGIVVMSVHSFQALSMQLANITFIRSRLLPYWVMANVLKVDRDNNLAYLALLSYIHNPSERRMHIRMTLPDMVEAAFHNSEQEMPGAVREVSYGGVALLAPRENPLREKEKGIVTLKLPNARLDIPGVFLQSQEKESLRSHIFRWRMTAKNEQLFNQFIYEQQRKIMGELRERR